MSILPNGMTAKGCPRAGTRWNRMKNGTITLPSGQWDWICLSPKKFKAPLASNAVQAHELKVIVFNKSDFAWAEEHARLVSPGCKLYLQPEWSKASVTIPLIIDYVKANPQWEISLQTHKYLNIP